MFLKSVKVFNSISFYSVVAVEAAPDAADSASGDVLGVWQPLSIKSDLNRHVANGRCLRKRQHQAEAEKINALVESNELILFTYFMYFLTEHYCKYVLYIYIYIYIFFFLYI